MTYHDTIINRIHRADRAQIRCYLLMLAFGVPAALIVLFTKDIQYAPEFTLAVHTIIAFGLLFRAGHHKRKSQRLRRIAWDNTIRDTLHN